MNKLQMAEQFRKAVQMFAASLSEEQAMEVATMYDAWREGKAYAAGEYCKEHEERRNQAKVNTDVKNLVVFFLYTFPGNPGKNGRYC